VNILKRVAVTWNHAMSVDILLVPGVSIPDGNFARGMTSILTVVLCR
jgi:hypothetical protein